MSRKRRPGEIMAGVRHTLDCHGKPIEVVVIADLHIGDRNVDMSVVKSLIDGVKNNENRYAILAGDLMNTAIMGGKSDVYGETIPPLEQLERCVELLTPIRDKILAIVPGNHEERIYRSVGIDTVYALAARLGLSHLYNADGQLVFLHFGKGIKGETLSYSIYVNHGHGGGGRRAGSKVNALEDFAAIIDADCFVVGHSHMPATFKRSFYRVCAQKTCAARRDQVFVNTASALSYGGYGKRGGYTPPSNSYPVIVFDNHEHIINVTL